MWQVSTRLVHRPRDIYQYMSIFAHDKYYFDTCHCVLRWHPMSLSLTLTIVLISHKENRFCGISPISAFHIILLVSFFKVVFKYWELHIWSFCWYMPCPYTFTIFFKYLRSFFIRILYMFKKKNWIKARKGKYWLNVKREILQKFPKVMLSKNAMSTWEIL